MIMTIVMIKSVLTHLLYAGDHKTITCITLVLTDDISFLIQMHIQNNQGIYTKFHWHF